MHLGNKHFGIKSVSIFIVFSFFTALFFLSGCKIGTFSSSVSFQEVPFSYLPGWNDDEQMQDAFSAFKKSCPVLMKGNPDRSIGLGTKAKDWAKVCRKTQNESCFTARDARRFFEENFRPHKIFYAGRHTGTFTGYYESELKGSLHRTAKYSYPLYQPPKDLVCISGQCGKKRFFGGLTPHHDREAIYNGALDGKGLEIVWIEDPVEAFFMHIQGSARVVMDNGKVIRLMYAGSNGHPFIPIGRVLVEHKKIRSNKVSMKTIRSWMSSNESEAVKLMNKNPRYIFFKKYHGDGPIGAMGIALTSERSLAIDRSFIPLGSPIWLNTAYSGNHFKIQRLFVAQDTGSAIKGPIRGDIFWGYGKTAASRAGRTKEEGEYYVLLPH